MQFCPCLFFPIVKNPILNVSNTTIRTSSHDVVWWQCMFRFLEQLGNGLTLPAALIGVCFSHHHPTSPLHTNSPEQILIGLRSKDTSSPSSVEMPSKWYSQTKSCF